MILPQGRWQRTLILLLTVLLAGVGWADASTARAGSTPAAQQVAAPLRLTLQAPPVATESVAQEPHLTLPAQQATTETAVAAESPRLELETGWCVTFIGPAAAGVESPDRDSVQGNPAEPEAPSLCQLAAGLSYGLAPGTQLNLGYQLPSRLWKGVARPFGLEELAAEPSEHGVTLGVQVTF